MNSIQRPVQKDNLYQNGIASILIDFTMKVNIFYPALTIPLHNLKSDRVMVFILGIVNDSRATAGGAVAGELIQTNTFDTYAYNIAGNDYLTADSSYRVYSDRVEIGIWRPHSGIGAEDPPVAPFLTAQICYWIYSN